MPSSFPFFLLCFRSFTFLEIVTSLSNLSLRHLNTFELRIQNFLSLLFLFPPPTKKTHKTKFLFPFLGVGGEGHFDSTYFVFFLKKIGIKQATFKTLRNLSSPPQKKNPFTYSRHVFFIYKFSTVLTFRLYIVNLLLVRSFFFRIDFSGLSLKRQYIFCLIFTFMLQLLR